MGEIPLKVQLSDQGLLKTQAFINGDWIDADDGATIDVTNPATGEVVASVAKVGAAETAQAIEAAEKAMESWRNLPAKARANILRDWFNVIMAHQEDLARIMTLEQGKVIAESRGHDLPNLALSVDLTCRCCSTAGAEPPTAQWP